MGVVIEIATMVTVDHLEMIPTGIAVNETADPLVEVPLEAVAVPPEVVAVLLGPQIKMT